MLAGDVTGMLQVQQAMFEQRVDPDSVTFNILLNALGRAGRTKEVYRFYRLMRKVLFFILFSLNLTGFASSEFYHVALFILPTVLIWTEVNFCGVWIR